MTKSILISAHTPSANTRALADAAMRGATHTDAGGLGARLASPFDIVAGDLEKHDALVIGTTENIGYMAGATKDMFDRCYNDWLDRTGAKPVAVYVRAGLDGTATSKALEAIIGAQKWRVVAPPLVLRGAWSPEFPGQVEELAMTLAAGLDAGIF